MGCQLKQSEVTRSLTRNSLRRIGLAPKNPDEEEDIKNLILLVSELDLALKKEADQEFPIEEITEIITLMDSLWGTVMKYFELRTRTQIRRSVTSGLVLRYKIIKLLASIVSAMKSKEHPSEIFLHTPFLKKSLVDFIYTKLEKKEKKSQSFSHLAVRVLGLWAREPDVILAFNMILDGITHGEIHGSYCDELPTYFRKT